MTIQIPVLEINKQAFKLLKILCMRLFHLSVILMFLLIAVLASFNASAQPSGQRQRHIDRMSKIMIENEVSMRCERTIKSKNAKGQKVREKTELQIFPFKNRLISTISVFKGRTSWSAQQDILALKLAEQEGENSHILFSPMQKGQGEKIPEIHLQLNMNADTFARVSQQKHSTLNIIAFEKRNLQQPFQCSLRSAHVQ